MLCNIGDILFTFYQVKSVSYFFRISFAECPDPINDCGHCCIASYGVFVSGTVWHNQHVSKIFKMLIQHLKKAMAQAAIPNCKTQGFLVENYSPPKKKKRHAFL